MALRDGQGRPVYVRGDDSSATTTDISLAARDSDGMPTYVRGFNVVSDANGDLYLYIDERGRVTADRSQARRDAIYAAREGARTLNSVVRGDSRRRWDESALRLRCGSIEVGFGAHDAPR